MRQINALQEYLTATTKRYNNGDSIPVEFGDQPHVKYDENGNPTVVVSTNVRDWLGKDISEAQEFRCIIDDTSHEVEHPRRTPQNAKIEFLESYPNCPKTASQIWNLLEDVYIDKKRTDDWKGLRKTRAFIIDKVLDNSYRHKKISSFDEVPAATMEGIFQVTQAGYAKGISELKNDDLKEFLAWVREQTIRLKKIGGPDEEENIADESIRGDGYYEEREEIYHLIMERFIDFIGIDNTDKAEDAADDTDIISGKHEVNEDELDFQETPENEKRKKERESLQKEIDGDNHSDGNGDAEEENENEANSRSEEESDTDEGDSETSASNNEESETKENNNSKKDKNSPDNKESEEQKEDTPLEKVEGRDSDNESETANEKGSDGTSTDAKNEEREDNTTTGKSDTESQTKNESQQDGETPRNKASASEIEDENEDDAIVKDHLETMEEMEEKGEAGEWLDVSSNSDYTDIGSRFEERYEEIQKIKERDNTATAEKVNKRDEMIDDKGTPDEVYRLLEERGLEKEVRKAFEELKTRDEWVDTSLGQRINTRKAVRRAAGDGTVNRLYERKKRAEIGDRAIAVALDLSQSMSEIEAKMALAALEIAASIIGDQFTACGYKSFKPSDSNYNVITTPLITGPDEDFEKSHLNAVWSGGRTPMASGIVEASKLLQECTKSEDVLIVITDGKPNLTTNGHSGQKKATEEARQRVRELKRGGVKVIGLGIGSINEPIMDEIFEGDFVTAKMDDFAEKLVEVYYNQMDVI